MSDKKLLEKESLVNLTKNINAVREFLKKAEKMISEEKARLRKEKKSKPT